MNEPRRFYSRSYTIYVYMYVYIYIYIHTYAYIETVQKASYVYGIEYRSCCVQARRAQFHARCSVLRSVRFVPCRFAPLTEPRFRGQMRRNFCFPLVDFNIVHSARRINAVQVYQNGGLQMIARELCVQCTRAHAGLLRYIKSEFLKIMFLYRARRIILRKKRNVE